LIGKFVEPHANLLFVAEKDLLRDISALSLSSKQPVDAKIAEAHGIKWVGPALDVSKL
jgi:hypothetical protein